MKYPDLSRVPYFAFDTETDGVDSQVNKAYSFQISLPDGRDYFFDIRYTPEAVRWLKA